MLDDGYKKETYFPLDLDWKKECLANVLSLEKKWFSLLVSRRAGPIDHKTASEKPFSGTENQRNCSSDSLKERKVLREGNQFLYFKESGSTVGTGNQRVDDSVLRNDHKYMYTCFLSNHRSKPPQEGIMY